MLVTAAAVSGCGQSAQEQDRAFIESVRADGYAIPFGVSGEQMLVEAARQVCGEPPADDTSELTRVEVIDGTFHGAADRFEELARQAYCPQ